MSSDRERYDRFTTEAFPPWCWGCGRGERCQPAWWAAPWFLHRHHIVKHPRVKDRRAVILLCPICHGRIHGERYPQEPGAPLTLPAQLWLKRTHDPEHYDRAFLRALHIGRLPNAHAPFREYQRAYRQLRGDYCNRRR